MNHDILDRDCYICTLIIFEICVHVHGLCGGARVVSWYALIDCSNIDGSLMSVLIAAKL